MMMIVGLLVFLSILPGTIELLLLTVGAILPGRQREQKTETAKRLRLAVVIPAHNEAAHIESCVESLLRCPRRGETSIVVVADNCSDDTAMLARRAGARVLERENTELRGKGYALDFAFRALMPEGFDGFVVVDADTIVDSNFILEFEQAFAAGADAAQCRYTVLNANETLRTRLMNVALMAFNVLRPRGRAHWGLSAGLLGNGFGLSRATLLAVPYEASSIVEDLEYHLRLVRSGRRVEFIDSTTVRAEMPVGGQGVATQRARWEGGRLRMLREFAPQLLGDLARGRWKMAEPLLDLLLLPLAFHVALLAVAFCLPMAWTRSGAIAGVLIVAAHVATALRIGGGKVGDVKALLAAPFYVVWKLSLLPRLWQTASRRAAWIRTERNSL